MPVDIVSRVRGRKLPLKHIQRTAKKILDFVEESGSELSLALVDDDAIARLNKKYRHKARATDVLSFQVEPLANGGPRILGDVVISIDKALEQAKTGGWTLNEEIDRLLIHGILHLLGYDHERSPKEARVMRALEKKISRAICGKRGAALL
jgi:probable rRNA maturation factor